MRGGVFVVAMLAACGRIGFDDRTLSGDGGPLGPDAPLPDGRWANVVVGELSTCAITTTAELWCWGFGYDGQLGIGALPTTAPPTKIGDGWRTVAVASDHACGVKLDGSLWCWGEDDFGQLGDNKAALLQVAPKLVDTGTLTWIDAAVGYQFSCALSATHQIACFGRDDAGQLGIGSNLEADLPVVLAQTWSGLAAGIGHVCAIRASNGSMWCWGQNGSRQLGTNDTIPQNVPSPVVSGNAYAKVAAGSTFTCGIETTGATSCWGDGEVGQLGIATTNGAATPIAQPGPALAAISLGRVHGCGIGAAGGLWCWGAAQHGAIAGLELLAVTTPQPIAASNPTQISVGGRTTCYIDDAGHLFCSGDNSGGQAGQPFGEVHAVVRSDASTDWTHIYAHRTHACGSHADGSTSCWGEGLDGEVGDGGYFDRQAPAAVALANIVQMDMGAKTTVAVVGSTELNWGYDFTTDNHNPLPTSYGPEIWVTSADHHGCGVNPSGVLRCGGTNNHGELGDGSMMSAPSTIVSGTWQTVRAASSFTCATTPGGQLSCWGDSSDGQLGNGMTGPAFQSPQAVLLSVAARTYALGGAFACAITPANDLYCWGANDRGQLGIGGGGSHPSPAHVGAAAWLSVAAGDVHACGIEADHSLWCWGHSDQGQLGDAGLVDVNAPQRVGTDTDWAEVAAGDHFTCALRLDGTRWCFGANDSGQLGNSAAWLPAFAVVP